MPFQVSPGVNVSEVDLTTVVPSVSTTEGGVAGHFRWGPVEQRTLVTSEDQLVSQFNKPNADTFETFFTAANFLSYGNALFVVRTNSTGLKNATANAGNSAITLVKNSDHYVNNYSGGISDVGDWIGKYPGALGNSLKVSVCPGSSAFKSTLSGTYTITSNTTALVSSTSQSASITAGDILELGPTAGAKQDVKVGSIAANGTHITLSLIHI